MRAVCGLMYLSRKCLWRSNNKSVCMHAIVRDTLLCITERRYSDTVVMIYLIYLNQLLYNTHKPILGSLLNPSISYIWQKNYKGLIAFICHLICQVYSFEDVTFTASLHFFWNPLMKKEIMCYRCHKCSFVSSGLMSWQQSRRSPKFEGHYISTSSYSLQENTYTVRHFVK